MKICICSSLSFPDEVNAVAWQLTKLGHEVLLPNGIVNRLIEQPNFDPTQAKIDTDSCHKHVDKIRAADVVLICNYTKNGIENYIGANTFAEIFVAKYFDKPIFSLHALPDMPYIHEELQSFGVINLDNDVSKIKHAVESNT